MKTYAQAIEMKAKWLRWATAEDADIRLSLLTGEPLPAHANILHAYSSVLERGDTFYMDTHFCKLVDHARKEVPDNLAYDASWLQSPSGFLWAEQPIEVPPLASLEQYQQLIHAVGWRPIPKGSKMYIGPQHREEIAKQDITQFLFFQDEGIEYRNSRSGSGFVCWSYFTLKDGDRLDERTAAFERHASSPEKGQYSQFDHRVNKLHEMRWLYTALHLMAQKYAMTVEHKPDRAARRRAEKEKRAIPPWIRVITLRRYEEARTREAHKTVNWSWQWEVRGHWRNQWYGGEGIHKPVFVEAYIKGPEGKPLKEGAHKLFVAKR